MNPTDPNAPKRLTFMRAFRPFWVTLALSLVLLAWDFNRRHFRETYIDARVTIEGREPEGGFVLKLDGIDLRVGEPVGVGWREIEVRAKDTESLLTNVFVWYGGNSLGEIDLERSRGKIALEAHPRPVRYRLRSRESEYSTPTGFFSNIPAGQYDAVFEYTEGLVDRIPVRVEGNKLSEVRVTNRVGSIEISLKGPGGDFVLEELRGSGRWKGTLPFSLPHVRPGEFRLKAVRGEYSLQWDRVVTSGETNRIEVEFAYGALDIATTPPDARVTLDRKEVGNTPQLVRDLIPGTYTVALNKDGFDPVVVEAVVTPNATNRIERKLVPTAYREAMESFGRSRERRRFREAEAVLEEALRIVPGDPTATGFVASTRAGALRESASFEIRRGGLSEAEKLLVEAEQLEPGSPETKALRDEIARARVEAAEAEKRRAEEAKRNMVRDAERALVSANAAIASGNLARAQTSLSEARSLVPDHPEIPAVADRLRAAEEKVAAENARRDLENQIASRRRELVAALEAAMRGDEHRPVKTLTFRTTKSARQVEFACEPKDGKGLSVYDVVSPRDYLITWRNGRLIPLLGVGSFFRLGAMTLAPNHTEVHVLVYSVASTPGGIAADPVESRNVALARSATEALKTALGGDLEPITR